MADLIDLHRRATGEFASRVRAIGDDQWHLPTPCTDWDVRALVNHLANENRWAPPLFGGSTIAEVGDRFDGDLLGDEPKAVWDEAAAETLAAVAEDGVLERIVHISAGDIPGSEYLSQLITDHTIHAWDLARGIGADETLDPELVEFSYQSLAPAVEDARRWGAFGPEVAAPPGSGRQAELLALSGRQP